MRVYMRTKTVLTDNVDLKYLKPTEKILLGIKYRYESSESFKKRKEEEEGRKELERVRQIDGIKTNILYKIHDVFTNMPDKESVTIKLDRKTEPYLAEVFESKEFLPYKITRLKENPDFLLSFNNLPILIVIEKEVILDEEQD